MRSGLQTEARTEEENGRQERGLRTGEDLERRFPVALALYGILALLAWFTMSSGPVMLMGRPVELRLIVLVVIGALALRTVIARHAEQIRSRGRE